MSGVDPVTAGLEAVGETAKVVSKIIDLENAPDVKVWKEARDLAELKDKVRAALDSDDLTEAHRLLAIQLFVAS